MTAPVQAIGHATLHLGDCLDVMRTLPDNSVDSIVTDPPYGLAFMGKKWDYDVPDVAVWAECLRVLKPGGHLLAFAGTRTQHRMAVRIEDAGFEIRDMIAWVYGSGFPKSLDVSKAIDKAAGAERDVIGAIRTNVGMQGGNFANKAQTGEVSITAPATEAARQWQGWGTALKPALEPITLARKPLMGTVAANVLRHGTGALNIDASRIGDFQNTTPSGVDRRNAVLADMGCRPNAYQVGEKTPDTPDGRWPANLIHDGSAEVLARFPLSDGQQFDVTGTEPSRLTNGIYGEFANRPAAPARNDTGSAARFFYVAKASSIDRDEGCHELPRILAMRYGEKAQGPLPQQTPSKPVLQSNHHPTVKPTDLMRYLLRLVTPPHGVALDPFLGSGSTGKAAMLEDFKFIGIERDPDYFAIACARLRHATAQTSLFAA